MNVTGPLFKPRAVISSTPLIFFKKHSCNFSLSSVSEIIVTLKSFNTNFSGLGPKLFLFLLSVNKPLSIVAQN